MVRIVEMSRRRFVKKHLLAIGFPVRAPARVVRLAEVLDSHEAFLEIVKNQIYIEYCYSCFADGACFMTGIRYVVNTIL